LKIPAENIRLISPFIGGGFGGKLWSMPMPSCGDRRAAAQAAGENRADPAADLSRHDAPLRHDPSGCAWVPIARAASSRSATMFSPAICQRATYEGAALQTRTLYAGPNG